MAAKMAIRDVARVRRLPLSKANELAKMVGNHKSIKDVKEFEEEKKKSDEVAKTLQIAEILEGSVRQTGIHACGVIIGKDDITNYIPLSMNKDAVLYVTQYEGIDAEACGMLKMDFLGLKTLSIIKHTLELLKQKNININIDNIPLDDKKTYELFSKGNTTGIFQFESDGMKKYLKQLKPNRFEDLIAMNALYRPGPMEYIPNYIKRKFGEEKITYPIPEMEEYLKDTYGITVYQEQVMLLSQKLAGFSKGKADTLRKAMGKKKKELMKKLKSEFIEGGIKNNYKKSILEKIWNDWEAFAEYAFNKAHSTCYSHLAYQTAYLKAHYPIEFFVALLNNNKHDIDSIKKFISDAKHLGIKILGPDVNESNIEFSINEKNEIQFGLLAIKDVSENAVKEILEERKQNGKFTSIFNFIERIKVQIVNKKNLEALAEAGAFDTFKIPRYKYFCKSEGENTFIEKLIEYGSSLKKNSASPSLFGEEEKNVSTKKPLIPEDNENCKKYNKIEKLVKEAEKIGFYLSEHPLDDYKPLIEYFSNANLSILDNIEEHKNKSFTIFAYVIDVKLKKTKKNKPFASLELEDFTNKNTLNVFNNLEKLNLDDASFFSGKVVMLKLKIETYKNNKGVEVVKEVVEQITNVDNFIKQHNARIVLYVPINKLNEKLTNALKELKKYNGGKSNVTFLFVDENEKLKLHSKTLQIALIPEFINYLNNLEKNFQIKTNIKI